MTIDCIVRAVRAAAGLRGFHHGAIAVALTDDPTIRQVNDRHLGHDYATDVISFSYEAEGDHVEGEMIVSLDTAVQQSERIGWTWSRELLLYIVHGTLHITGMDDRTPTQRSEMRDMESRALSEVEIDDVHGYHADRFEALDGRGDLAGDEKPPIASVKKSAENSSNREAIR